MPLSPRFDPGPYTIQWMLDVPRAPTTPPDRYIEAIVASLSQSGNLSGNNPVEVEIVRHRGVPDTITGILRIQFTVVQPENTVGNAILAAVQSVAPTAVPYRRISGATTVVPAVLSAIPAAILAAIPATRNAIYQRFTPEIVINVTPGIVESERPVVSPTFYGARASSISTRESRDPNRTGNVTTTDVQNAVRAAGMAVSEATTISTGTAIALSIVGAAILGGLGFVIYKKATS